MRHDKRKWARLPMRGFLSCSATFVHNDETVEKVPVLSLSAGGMYIALPENRERFQVGSAICEIRFDLGELETYQPRGTIVHRMSLGEIAGCGVEFMGMEKEQAFALDAFVKDKLHEFGLAEITN